MIKSVGKARQKFEESLNRTSAGASHGGLAGDPWDLRGVLPSSRGLAWALNRFVGFLNS